MREWYLKLLQRSCIVVSVIQSKRGRGRKRGEGRKEKEKKRKEPLVLWVVIELIELPLSAKNRLHHSLGVVDMSPFAFSAFHSSFV